MTGMLSLVLPLSDGIEDDLCHPRFVLESINYFSLGAGLSFVHASGVFSRALCLDPISFCTQPLGLEGTVRVTDTADAFAYNLGLLVKPMETSEVRF